MVDYLNFPRKFRVRSNLTVKDYLAKSGLTAAEKRKMTVYLKDIRLLFDFPYPDEEILIVEAIRENHEEKHYTVLEFAKAIAKSFPHRMLLIVHLGGKIRFFTFDYRENTRNSSRLMVDDSFSTFDLVLAQEDPLENGALQRMQRAPLEAKSGAELYETWKNEVLAIGTREQYTLDSLAYYNISEYGVSRKEEKKKHLRILQNLIDYARTGRYEDEEALDTDEGRETPAYVGEPLDVVTKADHRMYVEFCAAYAKRVFRDETGSEEVPEDKWIIRYLDACNEYSSHLFGDILDSDCIVSIARGAVCEEEEADPSLYEGFGFDIPTLEYYLGLDPDAEDYLGFRSGPGESDDGAYYDAEADERLDDAETESYDFSEDLDGEDSDFDGDYDGYYDGEDEDKDDGYGHDDYDDNY